MIEQVQYSNVQNVKVDHSNHKFEDTDIALLGTDIVIDNDECDTTSSYSSEESTEFIEDESTKNRIYSSSSSSSSGSDEESDKDEETSSISDSRKLYDLKKDSRIMFTSSNITVSEVL